LNHAVVTSVNRDDENLGGAKIFAETIRAIREEAGFKSLPIIAVTAKAMKGDREKCITAGASDYLAKPIDTEQLLSLLRVWLSPTRTPGLG